MFLKQTLRLIHHRHRRDIVGINVAGVELRDAKSSSFPAVHTNNFWAFVNRLSSPCPPRPVPGGAEKASGSLTLDWIVTSCAGG